MMTRQIYYFVLFTLFFSTATWSSLRKVITQTSIEFGNTYASYALQADDETISNNVFSAGYLTTSIWADWQGFFRQDLITGLRLHEVKSSQSPEPEVLIIGRDNTGTPVYSYNRIRTTGFFINSLVFLLRKRFPIWNLEYGFSPFIAFSQSSKRVYKTPTGSIERKRPVVIQAKYSRVYPVFAMDILPHYPIGLRFEFLSSEANLAHGYMTFVIRYNIADDWRAFIGVQMLNRESFGNGFVNADISTTIFLKSEVDWNAISISLKPGLVLSPALIKSSFDIPFKDRIFFHFALSWTI